MTGDLLHHGIGQTGSGRLRYAAAMARHAVGQISDDELEVYRVAAAFDHVDPGQVSGASGETADAPRPEVLIRYLVSEAALYLAGFTGPGIADVRAGIAQWSAGPVMVKCRSNPVVTEYLQTALEQLHMSHPALADSISTASPNLPWRTYDLYPPDQIGPDFATGHAFCSLIGEDGVIPATAFDFGLFLIAPHVLYRDHCHAAPELYAPLTGPHGWRFHPGAPLILKPAHQPVWNDPFRPHLTKVGPTPFLGLFCWTKDTQPAAQVIPANDWTSLAAVRLASSNGPTDD